MILTGEKIYELILALKEFENELYSRLDSHLTFLVIYNLRNLERVYKVFQEAERSLQQRGLEDQIPLLMQEEALVDLKTIKLTYNIELTLPQIEALSFFIEGE